MMTLIFIIITITLFIIITTYIIILTVFIIFTILIFNIITTVFILKIIGMSLSVWPSSWLTVCADSFGILLFYFHFFAVVVVSEYIVGFLCILMCLARFALILQSPHIPHLNFLSFTPFFKIFLMVLPGHFLVDDFSTILQAISIGVSTFVHLFLMYRQTCFAFASFATPFCLTCESSG